MNKAAIIRRLDSQFSYLTVDIPEEIRIDNESIRLKEQIDDIVRTAEDGDLEKVVRRVVELEGRLSKIVSDFRNRVTTSQIGLTEAEAQLEYYLGIRRALAILRGVSDDSLKRFSEKDEKTRVAEDRKRWFESLKDLEGN